MSLSGHQSAAAKSVDWLTPPEILQPLGVFDLDPCCPEVMPWETARRHLTIRDCGLLTPWSGRVWMNPPFGRDADVWLGKLAAHGNGIGLIPARTETRMFFAHVWGKATSILFLRNRPHFYRPDGKRAAFNSGAPICLVGYGEENDKHLAFSGLGKWVKL
jgi:hypothetical protein